VVEAEGSFDAEVETTVSHEDTASLYRIINNFVMKNILEYDLSMKLINPINYCKINIKFFEYVSFRYVQLSQFFTSSVPYRNVSKTFLKFQTLVNVDWLILPSLCAKKLICDELFIFIREYTRKYVDLSTSFQSTNAHQYVTVRLKWKTGFTPSIEVTTCPPSR
jgi:hypothetical protein